MTVAGGQSAASGGINSNNRRSRHSRVAKEPLGHPQATSESGAHSWYALVEENLFSDIIAEDGVRAWALKSADPNR